MVPTNQDLTQRMDKYEGEQEKHSEILTRVTTLLEALTSRIATVEADAKTAQGTLIDIGKAVVRFEERDAATQKWVAVVVSALISLIVGITMFSLGYFLHPS